MINKNKESSKKIHNIGETYTVILASNGEEGYKLAIDKQPDLVLTDIMMPVLDGYGLLKGNEKFNYPRITRQKNSQELFNRNYHVLINRKLPDSKIPYT